MDNTNNEQNDTNKLTYNHYTDSLWIHLDNHLYKFHLCDDKYCCLNNVRNTFCYTCLQNIQRGILKISIYLCSKILPLIIHYSSDNFRNITFGRIKYIKLTPLNPVYILTCFFIMTSLWTSYSTIHSKTDSNEKGT